MKLVIGFILFRTNGEIRLKVYCILQFSLFCLRYNILKCQGSHMRRLHRNQSGGKYPDFWSTTIFGPWRYIGKTQFPIKLIKWLSTCLKTQHSFIWWKTLNNASIFITKDIIDTGMNNQFNDLLIYTILNT